MRIWIGLGLLIALLNASVAQAQIYSWTDANGRVHYSDQATDKNAVLQSIDVGTMPAPKMIETAKPALFVPPLYPLIVAQFEYSEALLNNSKSAARFYFGGDCVSPTALRLEALFTRLPSVVRTPEQLQVDMFRAIRRLGHTSLYRAGHYTGANVDATAARYLRAQIIDFDIATCRADGASSSSSSELKEMMMPKFKIANGWLKVRWQLSDTPNGEPLFSIITEGSAATQINMDVNLQSVMRESFMAAAANALNDDHLRQALAINRDTIPADNNAPSSAPQPSPTATNWAEQQLLRQTNFVAALSELSIVKTMVAEYYQMRGVMPASISVLGITSETVQSSAYLSALQMQAPGVIYAELNAGKFSAGQFIELTPEISKGFTLIEWHCETSVDVKMSACPSL
ncbi:DUF4124 domain-containing protein [Gilvimarinus polysaccharolyticus]|uniref:DUF4124 domain-containing protein n=1 Tax=Gilvimarinus polysaccharolyticus TaxID=863921 RepID=UPI0006734D67|nr:DUF4124 domain-containing protein [Gilvimarinus polysaccharolyticus]